MAKYKSQIALGTVVVLFNILLLHLYYVGQYALTHSNWIGKLTNAVWIYYATIAPATFALEIVTLFVFGVMTIAERISKRKQITA